MCPMERDEFRNENNICCIYHQQDEDLKMRLLIYGNMLYQI